MRSFVFAQQIVGLFDQRAHLIIVIDRRAARAGMSAAAEMLGHRIDRHEPRPQAHADAVLRLNEGQPDQTAADAVQIGNRRAGLLKGQAELLSLGKKELDRRRGMGFQNLL